MMAHMMAQIYHLVTLSESMDYVAKQRIDSSSGNKTLTVTSGMAVSPQLSKKVKSNKKKS